MKYLAMASTALFLLATPGLALAQTTTDGSGGTSDAAGVDNTTPTDTSNGGAATKAIGEATGNAAGANNGGASDAPDATGGANQCGDETASAAYDTFSEKCRHQIDAWAMSQAGASSKFEGDIVVGAAVPETVEIVEVPSYHNYGYVMLNDRRVLVDRTTRKVVRVY